MAAPPCSLPQAQRAEILRRLVLRKACLPEHTVDTLDLRAIAMETDGYLARDLALLLERAVHASAVREERINQGTPLHTPSCDLWASLGYVGHPQQREGISHDPPVSDYHSSLWVFSFFDCACKQLV